MNRYDRQIKLKEFGNKGQIKLASARVLVIGAGGLGCPALLYLVGAGIGHVGIIDHDLISLDNLHRQILYKQSDVGSLKAIVAADYLRSLNSDIRIKAYNELLCKENIEELFLEYDLILDGTDNFDSRYLINDAAVILRKTLIQGSVNRYQGQVAVFNACQLTDDPANYRDLFPEPPLNENIQNCEEAGVIGTLPGIIGCIMASEAIKIISGIGQALVNTLLTYDSLSNQTMLFEIRPAAKKEYKIADSINELKEVENLTCENVLELEIEDISDLLEQSCLIVDIREVDELPKLSNIKHLQIPLSKIAQEYASLQAENILLICASGKRSLSAGRDIASHFKGTKNIYSLKGGLMSWTKYQQNGK